jgi:hypothetical protein
VGMLQTQYESVLAEEENKGESGVTRVMFEFFFEEQ